MSEARNFMQMYFRKNNQPKVFKEMQEKNRLANVRQQIARLERQHFGGIYHPRP